MAVRELNSDKWVSSAGGRFNSMAEAKMHENVTRSNNSGTNFQFEALGAIWKLFCLIPHLLGVAIGAVCGLVLKLGIVGRVILSALVAFAVLIFLLMPFSEPASLTTLCGGSLRESSMWPGLWRQARGSGFGTTTWCGRFRTAISCR
ncbi:MAG: hypothetical protein LBU97_04145 [Alistipes sp.]|nr:hypothetical protein [Alistipes sp.]